jgi:hypothetical protein
MRDMTGYAERHILLSLSDRASNRLKTLLETKHLYQKVDVNPDDLVQKFSNTKDNATNQRVLKWATETLRTEKFTLADQQLYVAPRGVEQQPVLTLKLPHVSLFCKKCGRREAFAPVWFTDSSNEIRVRALAGQKPVAMPFDFQLFSLVYQCQRCLGTPEGFLVRRDGWSIGLHGRTPMELVEIPKYIPDDEARHYRDAVIAFNSGKVLAALFYLRTFIEQFGRRMTGIFARATGDEIFDAYSDKLPPELRPQMPSLKDWYDKISEALHIAKEDADLFDAAKTAIEKHFEIRKVFNIPENRQVPGRSEADKQEASLPDSSPKQAHSKSSSES